MLLDLWIPPPLLMQPDVFTFHVIGWGLSPAASGCAPGIYKMTKTGLLSKLSEHNVFWEYALNLCFIYYVRITSFPKVFSDDLDVASNAAFATFFSKLYM